MEEVKSREAKRKAVKKNQDESVVKAVRVQVRILPIWARLVIIVGLVLISIVSGVMVGYGLIGNGNPFDALKPTTWTRIVDFVQKGT